MGEKLVASLLMSMLLLSVASGVHAKECSRLVTTQMRANAVANVKKFDWAAREQKSAISKAQAYLKCSDDKLWKLVRSHELPRDPHTNPFVGCPDCGEGITPYGNCPWKFDFWNKPWKLTYPNCCEVFPNSDSCGFYETALDDHGSGIEKKGKPTTGSKSIIRDLRNTISHRQQDRFATVSSSSKVVGQGAG